MIQLSDVRVFLEIVSAGSFTGAARALRMPKSSVARQMARLEALVGCALLSRASRAVTLTDEGRSFLPHARRLLADGIEAQNILRANGKGPTGQLTISATALFARTFLVPFLPEFLERNPHVRLSMWLTSERVEIGSGPGQADIAVRLRSVAAPDLGTRKLGELAFAIVASPAYLAKHGRPAEPADLACHAVIELGPPTKSHLLQLARGREVAQVRYTPILHIDEPDAVRLAVLAGVGIAVLPKFLVAPALRDGTLVPLLAEWAQPPVPVNLLYRTDIAPPLRVRAYLDFLAETLGHHPELA